MPIKALKVIDSAIPYLILFLIEKGSVEKAVICYKEQSQKDENSAKVDTYFETEWNDERLKNIKIAGDKLSTTKTGSSEVPKNIKDDVEAMKEREKIQKQIDALTRRINAEPSLGKKQELAEERYKLRQLLQNSISIIVNRTQPGRHNRTKIRRTE